MRISILADQNGKIIATLCPVDSGEGPTHVHLRVGAGQNVYQVVLPEELKHLRSLVSLHNTHKIEIRGQEAFLIACN